ncbi:PspA/IM30 family protein [Raineya sp.]|jgi:phage shock protein A
MFGWLKKTKKEAEDEIPEKVIESTITEMEEAIRKEIASLNLLAKNYKAIQEKINELQYKAYDLGKEALRVVKQGNSLEAKNLLSHKADCELQIKEYQEIAKEMETSIRKLEKQVSKMKVQLDRTKSKKAILVAEYANAQTQKELAQKLQELDIQTDVFETSIIQTQVEAGLHEDPLLKEFENLAVSDNTIENLQKEAEAQERKLKEQQELNKQKYLETIAGKDFFKPTPASDKQKNIQENFFKENATQKKSQILEQFWEKQSESKNENLFEDFFGKEASKKTISETNLDDFFDENSNFCINIDSFLEQSQKEKVIQDFFSDSEAKELAEIEKSLQMNYESPQTDLQKKFDDFFKTEPTSKSDKQKQIDDFFKNT